MATGKKAKLVVIKEEASASEVAADQVAAVVSGANVMDAVSVMAGDFVPEDNSVLVNEDFRVVACNLTDRQAKDLETKTGVEAVEDDEEVFALSDGGPFEDDLGPIDDAMIADDEEAAAAIDEMMDGYQAALFEQQEETAHEQARFAAQHIPAVDDAIDFDEMGQLVALGGPAVGAGETSALPRDQIVKLIACIIRCAVEQFGGKVGEVSDDKIAELLAGQGFDASSASAAAIRDYITCGLRISYVPHAWRYSKGAGVRVAVVDTGIAPRHPDLRVYGGASFVPGVTSWADDHSHGTHVAGTIAATLNNRGLVGVAPHARLYAVKVLNRAGSGRTSWILNGLAWCSRARMHVVNLSLGALANNHNLSDYSRAYENAGRLLRRAGILAVAAAGNSGGTTRPYVGNPARCPSFMAVSAVDCQRRRAPFSSYGPQVEVTAPGVSVRSTIPPSGYGQKSGTSMATPHVAGVAALVKRRHPNWHGDTIRIHLRRTALDLGTPGHDWFFGFGQANAFRAVL